MPILILAFLTHQLAYSTPARSTTSANVQRSEARFDLGRGRYLKIEKYFGFPPAVARIARTLACDQGDTLITGGCKTSVGVTFQNGAELYNVQTQKSLEDASEASAAAQLVWSCDVAQARLPKGQEPPLELEINVICQRSH